MELKYLLNLAKGNIVSIVGAGGKTSLMFALAREYKENKVLVTTSTKIFKPEKKNYDYLSSNTDEGESFKLNKNPGIYVLGSNINEENKLIGINDKELKDYYKYFDYVFIEADGSKRKPLKGWKESEPVILNRTTRTIGVVSIKVINSVVCEENVHRLDRFTAITSLEVNKKIRIEDMARLILHSEGLFKNSRGEKILFINQADSDEDMFNAEGLAYTIRNIDTNYVGRIVIGSIKNNSYKLV